MEKIKYDMTISKDIIHIGASDKDIKIFESQYVLENGMSYNSYVIKDKKNVVLDTIDEKLTDQWLENLEKALDGEKPDYLIVSHMEPDHAYNIGIIAKKYPDMKIVGNQITFNMLSNFFKEIDFSNRKFVVMEGDVLDIGTHKLQFFMAPMVHWPEVMVTYEQTEKILFSADAFGKFGTLDTAEPWIDEARRYYFNIVGKYGMQVQSLLNKLLNLKINMVCSLHGPILKDNLSYYINLYDKWSKYEPEEDGIIIVCGSLHGNTYNATKELEKELTNNGNNVKLVDISKTSEQDILPEVFKYSKLCIASVTYNMNIFPKIDSLINLLKEKNYQNRKVGIIENGSWAPNAAKIIKDKMALMKNIEIIEPIVTIKTRLDENSKKVLEKLAENLSKN